MLPNEPPYYLRLGKRVTVNFGQPIDLSELISGVRKDEVAEPEARKMITDRIEMEMEVGNNNHSNLRAIGLLCLHSNYIHNKETQLMS